MNRNHGTVSKHFYVLNIQYCLFGKHLFRAIWKINKFQRGKMGNVQTLTWTVLKAVVDPVLWKGINRYRKWLNHNYSKLHSQQPINAPITITYFLKQLRNNYDSTIPQTTAHFYHPHSKKNCSNCVMSRALSWEDWAIRRLLRRKGTNHLSCTCTVEVVVETSAAAGVLQGTCLPVATELTYDTRLTRNHVPNTRSLGIPITHQ